MIDRGYRHYYHVHKCSANKSVKGTPSQWLYAKKSITFLSLWAANQEPSISSLKQDYELRLSDIETRFMRWWRAFQDMGLLGLYKCKCSISSKFKNGPQPTGPDNH